MSQLPEIRPLDLGERPVDVSPAARRAVLIELAVLWLLSLLAIRAVVMIQAAGLPEVLLAAVPFIFIYAPVWLCARRNVDSFAYHIAIPNFTDAAAWGRAAMACARVVAVILVPWLVGYHLYQNVLAAFFDAAGPLRTVDDGFAAVGRLLRGELGLLGDAPWATLTRTATPTWRLPKDVWLLVPYHLFFVAIPEEFFYRGYFQTRLNEVFPRKFLIFGTPVGWGMVIASLFFAFGHSLVTVRWWHFATFFPGLLFGWLRERTRGTLSGALCHAWANVTVTWLDTLYGLRP